MVPGSSTTSERKSLWRHTSAASSLWTSTKRDFTLILCLNTSVTKEPWTTSIEPWSRQYNKNKQKTGSSTQVTIHVVSMPLCGRDWELQTQEILHSSLWTS